MKQNMTKIKERLVSLKKKRKCIKVIRMDVLYLYRVYWYMCLMLKSTIQAVHLLRFRHSSKILALICSNKVNWVPFLQRIRLTTDLFREKSYLNTII